MKVNLINLEPLKEKIKEKLLEIYSKTTYMNTEEIRINVGIEDLIEEYIKEKELVEPKVYITSDAYIKMRMLVDEMSTEVGWYGTVERMPALNSYIITDILVYPQEVTGATCNQNEEKMYEFELDLTTDQVNSKRFQGHSHVNMATSPSGVDETFYQDLLTQVEDYFIITITNKRNEYTTRFYDIANNVLYTEVPIEVIDSQGLSITEWYEENEKQITKPISKIKTPRLTPNPYDDYEYEYDYLSTYYNSVWKDDKKKGRKKK